MQDTNDGKSGAIFMLILYIVITLSYLHGLYMSIHEGFGSFVLVMLIFPWAIIKGFFGFF
jgi:hypothetical protein